MFKAACIALACLALMACSHQPRIGVETSTIVTETQVAEVNVSVTPAMLVGRWAKNGDCTQAIALSADGSFQSHTDGAGTWVLAGNILTMSANADVTQVWVGTIGADQLVFGHQDNSADVMRRCPQ